MSHSVFIYGYIYGIYTPTLGFALTLFLWERERGGATGY